MDTEGRRRSDNFEDRGAGGRNAGGGLAGAAFVGLLRTIGLRGTLILVAVLGVGYLIAPAGIKQAILGALSGGSSSAPSGPGIGSSVCAASPAYGKACDFSRVVLASTEDVWAAEFGKGALPDYGRSVSTYRNPTLVVFSEGVATGCGNATSDVGPFYCSADGRLYLDPSFYDTMARRLHAPGDFAQAYVIAHEVGHHVQNLIGAQGIRRNGEDRNHTSVRLELQADCLAGVWGHTARASLSITDEDLRDALNAAHNIGDDALGHRNTATFTHGSSQQRMHWFRRGFDSGDARQCDTFGAPPGAL
ncbi:MAG TPA: neutral zinc metallopeptidase [Polyangia bacterium]|nr:neutral zinc metallopeptidase [Polyangia bacterium]